MPPAKTASAIWHTISWTSRADNLSPSALPSKTCLTFIRHSLRGWGPGALPPEVTSLAPLGLMSEKSNLTSDFLLPPIYDSTNSFTASAQPSIESPTTKRRNLSAKGLVI